MFPIIGAHVLGMYALVLVVGGLIDRIGRSPALALGLLVMALSCIGLLWVDSVVGDRDPVVRPRDRLERLVRRRHRPAGRPQQRRPSAASCWASTTCSSALFGAALCLMGGVALDSIGVAALAIGATAIAAAPVLWLLPRALRREVAA